MSYEQIVVVHIDLVKVEQLPVKDEQFPVLVHLQLIPNLFHYYLPSIQGESHVYDLDCIKRHG